MNSHLTNDWGQCGKKELCWYCAGRQIKRQRQVITQTGKTGIKTDTGTDRQKHKQRDSQPFRINTGALNVAQEEIIFFDVKPCVLAGVWGIEVLSKQTSAPLTPSRSVVCVSSSLYPVYMCTETMDGGSCTQNLWAWYASYAFSLVFFFFLLM